MGSYLNPGNFSFRGSLRSKIYIDKSKLIARTNEALCTEQKYICVSRPRRFGKSMAANMLAAYYDRSEHTNELFENLKISKDQSYRENLNRYDVIKINIQEFLSMTGTVEEMLEMLKNYLISDFKEAYPKILLRDEKNLIQVMKDVFSYTKCPFVILIDEWDCLFREYKQDKEEQKKYLDFLRAWLKDKDYVALAYMTGILPIKKIKTQSALNNFDEFTMLDAGRLAPYIGFTETEVKQLCSKYKVDFDKVKRWYDGYLLEKIQVYNPKAVVSVLTKEKFKSYWSETGTYESIIPLINMNFDGLKNAVIEMLSGANVEVDVTFFQNDTVNFADKDDVLTYLIHLGYLGYDEETESAFVPNEEIRQELIRATKRTKWNQMIEFQQESLELLEATLSMDSGTVAEKIEKIHMEYASSVQYNNENSLSSVLTIAYLSSMQFYFKPVRELPTGKGFADFIFIPKPEYRAEYPALVVELKWNQNVNTAIQQIRDKNYPDSIEAYTGDILIVGISYDKKSKKHLCKIEEYKK